MASAKWLYDTGAIGSPTNSTVSNVVALLRMPLFTHRDLWAWLDNPFHGPPTVLIATQAELELG